MPFSLSSVCHTYETIKYVRIPDARLASLRGIFQFLIVVYVVVIEMLGKGGHLEASRVVGTIRFSLRQPTKGQCDPTASTDPEKPCLNDFLPLDQLPYCQQANRTSQRHQKQQNRGSIQNGTIYSCQIYEAVNAQLIRETSIVVWTKAIVQNETLVCSGVEEEGGGLPTPQHNYTCPRTYEATSTKVPFYIAQPERFTLLLDHAVTAGRICEQRQKTEHSSSTSSAAYACSTQSSDLFQSGRLYSIQEEQCRQHFLRNNSYSSATGDKVQSSAPCFIGANQTNARQDFFSLNTLLEAAGLDLDSCNTRRELKEDQNDESLSDSMVGNCAQTFRESGATLLVNIVWNDFHPYRLGVAEQPFYYYKVTWIGNVYKEQIPYYTQSYRSHRTLVSAHGIQINVLVTGNFHHFEWLNFWITMTAAVGLLAVATTVVDSCMLYFLPESQRYQEIKYEAPLELAGPGEIDIIRYGNVDHCERPSTDPLLPPLEQPLLSQGA
jgi:hypothetical protein